jgi:hypothetical protein
MYLKAQADSAPFFLSSGLLALILRSPAESLGCEAKTTPPTVTITNPSQWAVVWWCSKQSPNIMLGWDAREQRLAAKLCDFGSACTIDGRRNTSSEQQSQGPIGTPLWMAPEMLSIGSTGDETTEDSENKYCIPCSPSSDVFSFAMIVWEMLTGDLPWADKFRVRVSLLSSPSIRRWPHRKVLCPNLPQRLVVLGTSPRVCFVELPRGTTYGKHLHTTSHQ